MPTALRDGKVVVKYDRERDEVTLESSLGRDWLKQKWDESFDDFIHRVERYADALPLPTA
jgi:hypothetical protein